MTQLTLIRGLPNTGKTTMAKQLQYKTMVERQQTIVHLEADQFFTKNNEYNFNPEYIATAHRWCQNATEALLRLHHDVVVSNTFTTLREMVWYRNLARDLGAGFTVIETTLEIKGNNWHNVPVNSINRMRERWEAIPDEWYNWFGE